MTYSGAYRMRLLRLATVTLQPKPVGVPVIDLVLNASHIEELRRWEDDGELRLLLGAHTALSRPLHHLPSGQLEIPVEERKALEAAIEATSNLAAISRHARRSISSPFPPVALQPQNEEEARELVDSAGIAVAYRVLSVASPKVDFDLLARSIGDRLDGVALLAEALASPHVTGRFHELIRFFERAFARSPSRLEAPLGTFLARGQLFFTKAEIRTWIQRRDPATHADKAAFHLQANIQPVIARMELGAYDVLLNKALWRSDSTERRDRWEPDFGPLADGGQFAAAGMRVEIEHQLLDEFGVYPKNLVGQLNRLPDGWWAAFPEGEGIGQSPLIVRRGRCHARKANGARCTEPTARTSHAQLCARHLGMLRAGRTVIEFDTGAPRELPGSD